MQKPRTLREQYGVLDNLNAGSISDDDDRRRRLMRISYRGQPFGDHVPDYDGKEFVEALSFALLAVANGIDSEIVNIENRVPPEPDLAVTLTGGREIYVEVAQVTASGAARAASAVKSINGALTERYNSDAGYAAALSGRFVEYRFPSIPTSRETRAVPDEIIAVFYATDFATMQRKKFLKPDPAIAPILGKIGAKYYIGQGTATAMSMNIDAHTFDPDESADDFDERLRDKMTKTYTQGRPIWLALILTDPMQVPSLSMDGIRGRLPATIGQFDRLLFGTLEDGEMIVKPGT